MPDTPPKPEFWESHFRQKQEMWGFEPAQSALFAKDFFVSENIQNILIPGIGYGRNAQVFLDEGIHVTGIEISPAAIEMAHRRYGNNLTIHQGSVADMPFDNKLYDGIFCYALIHLLDTAQRRKLIQDCYNQLTDNGCMVFTMISKTAPNYGRGRMLSNDRYELHEGAPVYFYDTEAIKEEFGSFGLFGISELTENFPFFLIKCRKNNSVDKIEQDPTADIP